MKTTLLVAAGFLLLTLVQAKPAVSTPTSPWMDFPSTCTHNGRTYNFGDSFEHADGCNSCTCGQFGFKYCTRKKCTPCHYAGPDGDTKVAKDGDTFDDGCNTCWCNEGEVSCTFMECTGKCGYTNYDGYTRYLEVGTGVWHQTDEGVLQVCYCTLLEPYRADYECVDYEW